MTMPAPHARPIMPLQELFALHDDLLEKRLETLLPRLMNEAGVDMWIVIGDEYNEGPGVRSFLPSSFIHARRKALFVMAREDDGTVKRFVVSRPDFTIDRFFTPVLLKPPGFDFETFYTTFAPDYDLEKIRAMEPEDTWQCVGRIVREHDPTSIAIEVSSVTAFADGLSKSNYDALAEAIGERYRDRLVSAEALTVRWLETRIDEEIDLLAKNVSATRDIIAECYSTDVIVPGTTTLGEARFYLMERGYELGMVPWFEATVWARRPGHAHLDDDDTVIEPGDLLHCDVGFTCGGLNSDVQEMAYVNDASDPNNGAVIARLQEVHATATRLQDIAAAEFREGATGNEILAAALERAKREGIARAMIYTHPIGLYGHGPGPTIGTFGNQEFVEGTGEYKLHDRTCYALELNVREEMGPWDDLVVMYGQEIDVVFRDGRVEFPAGRQETLRVIG
jgi:Xaa-Pro aminopeptidase